MLLGLQTDMWAHKIPTLPSVEQQRTMASFSSEENKLKAYAEHIPLPETSIFYFLILLRMWVLRWRQRIWWHRGNFFFFSTASMYRCIVCPEQMLTVKENLKGSVRYGSLTNGSWSTVVDVYNMQIYKGVFMTWVVVYNLENSDIHLLWSSQNSQSCSKCCDVIK